MNNLLVEAPGLDFHHFMCAGGSQRMRLLGNRDLFVPYSAFAFEQNFPTLPVSQNNVIVFSHALERPSDFL
jgi:hypothetical protein